MQNLLDGHKDTDDIYDVLEEPKDRKKLLLVIFIVAIVAILAFSLYYFINAAPQQQATERRQALQNIPLLKPSGALKKIPENTGGLNIPHQDKKVFETIETQPSPPSPQDSPESSPQPSPQTETPDDTNGETTNDDTTTVLPPPETPVAPTPEPSPPSEPEPSPEPSQPAGRLQIDIFAPPSPEPAPEPSPSSEEQGEELPEAREEQQEQGQQEGGSNSDKLEIIIPPIQLSPSPEPSPEPSPPSPSAEEQGELPQAEEEQETGQQEQGGQEQGGEGQGGEFSVQFAALSDAASAEVIRNDILQRFSAILPTHRLPDGLIVAMDKLADGSDIFRVQMENLDYDTAQEICRQAKQDNQDCFVKREANAEGGEEQGEG